MSFLFLLSFFFLRHPFIWPESMFSFADMGTEELSSSTTFVRCENCVVHNLFIGSLPLDCCCYYSFQSDRNVEAKKEEIYWNLYVKSRFCRLWLESNVKRVQIECAIEIETKWIFGKFIRRVYSFCCSSGRIWLCFDCFSFYWQSVVSTEKSKSVRRSEKGLWNFFRLNNNVTVFDSLFWLRLITKSVKLSFSL